MLIAAFACGVVGDACQAWCSQYTCLQPPCFDCAECLPGYTDGVNIADNTASAIAVAPASSTRFSYELCVGAVDGTNDGRERALHVVRNTGGGTSTCCHEFPQAGGARVLEADSTAFELELQPRGTVGAAAAARNGARVYLADSCEGRYDPQAYTNLQLLGKTLSFEVDLVCHHFEPGACDRAT